MPLFNCLRGQLLATDGSVIATILRITLAVVMFPHGAQKMLGWFGGHGLEGTMGYFTEVMGLHWFVVVAVILIEFFGPLLLVIGLATRAAAAGFIAVMIGAIATVHGEFGFFMNWLGAQSGEGFEYHLLVLGMAAALLFSGGGKWSIDKKLAINVHQRLENRASDAHE